MLDNSQFFNNIYYGYRTDIQNPKPEDIVYEPDGIMYIYMEETMLNGGSSIDITHGGI